MGDILASAMQRTVNRNLLKYSAGTAIFCPKCDKVADYRRWVITERPDGSIASQCCASCHDAAIGDNPLPEGYTIIRECKPAKKPALPLQVTVQLRDGTPFKVDAAKAFDMFGHSFVAHPSLSNPALWTVSHLNTGGAISHEKSKAAAIRTAKSRLEAFGEAKFIETIAMRFPQQNKD